jgi:acetyl esterase/lipase
MRSAIVLALVALALVAGARPTASQGGLRYYDEVFPNVSVTTNLAYGQAPDEFGEMETLLLDLYEPVGDTEPARPVVIWVHGGGFTGGSKSNPNLVELAERFAKRGYVAASINYRLHEGSPNITGEMILNAQYDAQAAVRWFRANAATHAIDTTRIAIGGSSAGAVTALQVTYNTEDVGSSGNPDYSSESQAAVSLAGFLPYTPHIEAGEPPLMMAHGTADTTVPYSLAVTTCNQAVSVGVPCDFHTLEGKGHNWSPHMQDVIVWTRDFLHQELIGEGAVGGVASLPYPSNGSGGPLGTYEALAAGLALLALAAIVVRARARGAGDKH